MPRTVYEPAPNDPTQPGSLACRKRYWETSQGCFAVAAIHTRFDAVEWFVWLAAESFGEPPAVIRQEPTFDTAVSGLGYDAAEAEDDFSDLLAFATPRAESI